jgi:hypothetical protein
MPMSKPTVIWASVSLACLACLCLHLGVRPEEPGALGFVAAPAARARPVESLVIVCEGLPLPKLKPGAVVRLVESGPAGSEISASASGSLELTASRSILRVKEGKVLLGGVAKEFEFKATRRGKATLRLTNTPPGGPKASARELTVEVE